MNADATPTRRSDVYRVLVARFTSRAGSEAAFFVGIWGKAAYTLHATPGQLAFIMFMMSAGSILGSIIAGVLVDRHGPAARARRRGGRLRPGRARDGVRELGPGARRARRRVGVRGRARRHRRRQLRAVPHARPRRAAARSTRASRAWARSRCSSAPRSARAIVHYANVDWVFVIDAAHLARRRGRRLARAPAAGRAPAERAPSAATSWRDGIRAAYGIRPVRYYILAGSVVWMSFGAFGALEPLFFRDVVHTGVETLGWINTRVRHRTARGRGAAAEAAARRRLGARPRRRSSCSTGSARSRTSAPATCAASSSGALLWGLVIGGLDPLVRTLTHRDTPEELVGRVIGTSEVHRRIGELVPLAVAPALALRFGVQATLIGGGVVGARDRARARSARRRAIDRMPHRERRGRSRSPPPTSR